MMFGIQKYFLLNEEEIHLDQSLSELNKETSDAVKTGAQGLMRAYNHDSNTTFNSWSNVGDAVLSFLQIASGSLRLDRYRQIRNVIMSRKAQIAVERSQALANPFGIFF